MQADSSPAHGVNFPSGAAAATPSASMVALSTSPSLHAAASYDSSNFEREHVSSKLTESSGESDFQSERILIIPRAEVKKGSPSDIIPNSPISSLLSEVEGLRPPCAIVPQGHVTGMFSSPPRKGRRFKGVRHRKWGRCVCEIRDAIGKRIWLGSYDTEEQAARVYDAAARILQGRSAYLNFPNEAPVELPRGMMKTLVEQRDAVVRYQPSAPGSQPTSPTQLSHSVQYLRSASQPLTRIPATSPSPLSLASSFCSPQREWTPCESSPVSPGCCKAVPWESALRAPSHTESPPLSSTSTGNVVPLGRLLSCPSLRNCSTVPTGHAGCSQDLAYQFFSRQTLLGRLSQRTPSDRLEPQFTLDSINFQSLGPERVSASEKEKQAQHEVMWEGQHVCAESSHPMTCTADDRTEGGHGQHPDGQMRKAGALPKIEWVTFLRALDVDMRLGNVG